jgi:hypothetical protein
MTYEEQMFYPVREVPGVPRNPGETTPDYILRASAALDELRRQGKAPAVKVEQPKGDVSRMFAAVPPSSGDA